MAIALVGTPVSSYSSSVTKTVTTGNVAIFFASGGSGTITTPTKTGTCTIGTITQVGSTYGNGYNEVVAIFWMPVTGSGTLILTIAGTLTDPGCSIHEYSGMHTTAPIDVAGGGTTGTVTSVTHLLNTVHAGSVVVMIFAEEDGTPRTATATSPYTLRTAEADHCHGTLDYIVPSDANYTATGALSGSGLRWGALAAALKPSGTSPVTVSLNVATLVASPQTLAIVPGAVIVALAIATVSAAAQTLTVVPGAVAVVLNAATITSSPQTVAVIPGAVTVSINAATLTAAPQAISISAPSGVNVTLHETILASAAQTLTVVPGAVAVVLNAATLAAAAQTVTAVQGAVSISIGVATLTAWAQTITAVSGSVSVNLNGASLNAGVPNVTVTGGTAIVLSDAEISFLIMP